MVQTTNTSMPAKSGPTSTTEATSSDSNAAYRGLPFEQQVAAKTPSGGPPPTNTTPTQTQLDNSFLWKWDRYGRKPEMIDQALEDLRVHVGGKIPKGYVPPPRRSASQAKPASGSGGAPGDWAMGSPPSDGGVCLDPNGQSTLPSKPGPLDDTSGKQSIDPSLPAQSPQAKQDKPSATIGVDGPFGIGLKFDSEGATEGSGKFKLAKLGAKRIQLCPGIYAELDPKLSGSFSMKRDPGSDSWTFKGGGEISIYASLRGGIQEVVSVGGGVELEASVSLSATHGPNGWSSSPLTLELSGTPKFDFSLGPISVPWAPGGTYQLLVVTLGPRSGIDFRIGKDVSRLFDDIFGWDPKHQLEMCRKNYEGGGASGAPSQGCDAMYPDAL